MFRLNIVPGVLEDYMSPGFSGVSDLLQYTCFKFLHAYIYLSIQNI